MSKMLMLTAILAMLISSSTAEDKCSMFTSCRTCLNITSGDEGHRKDCGWCHFNVNFYNGTIGGRCADITDSPWRCRDLFDTYKCSLGFKCNETSGICMQSTEGDGYGSNKTCTQYCHPHHPPKPATKYMCNTTTGICMTCDPNDQSACEEDRKKACDNCQVPPGPTQDLFSCNRSDIKNPTCKKCDEGQQGCASYAQACTTCAPPTELYQCDEKTVTCKVNPQGFQKQVCDENCAHITPVNLLGDWRGLMVKEKTKGQFEMGEYDMHFGDANMTLTMPDRSQKVFDTATTGYNLILTEPDTGDKYHVTANTLAYLKYTQAYGFATKGKNIEQAPDSVAQAMADTMSTVWVMWKCNGADKTKCDFNPGMSLDYLGDQLLRKYSQPEFEEDNCNKYPDCHSCITATEDHVKCGWCMGAFLNYKDRGMTKFKCGGFQGDAKRSFTCARDFKTQDCTGWGCDWSSSKCSQSENGEFPDEQSCTQVCKPTDWKVCNLGTKKCEGCKQGDPGCNTDAYCNATCGLARAVCNHTSGTCHDCDPIKDKDCTQTKGACAENCTKQNNDHSVCNFRSGKCEKCAANSTSPGCVPDAACNASCSPKPPSQYLYDCNWTSSEPTCHQQENGTQTMDQCNTNCRTYSYGKCDDIEEKCVSCDQTKDPDCMYTMDFCKIIAERGGCKDSTFSKCDMKKNQCVKCTRGIDDPKCIFTKAQCDLQQKAGKCKPLELEGLYRSIMVSPGYLMGEFDQVFDASYTEQYFITSVQYAVKAPMEITGTTQDDLTQFKVTGWHDPKGVWPSTFYGAYKLKEGQSQIFKFLEMALSPTGEVTSLDQGLMKGNGYWVGIQCLDKDHCDFTKATPHPTLTLPSEYYTFLSDVILQ